MHFKQVIGSEMFSTGILKPPVVNTRIKQRARKDKVIFYKRNDVNRTSWETNMLILEPPVNLQSLLNDNVKQLLLQNSLTKKF